MLTRSLELAHGQFGHRLEPLPASIAVLVGLLALIILGLRMSGGSLDITV